MPRRLRRMALVSALLALTPLGAQGQNPTSTLGDTATHCTDGVSIVLASGKIVKSQLCVTQKHGDTSYVVAYAPDHREVFRSTGWHVTHAQFDSAYQALTTRLDKERGRGKPCRKQGIERYWGSPPDILILRIDPSDLEGLPVGISLAHEAERPRC